MSFASKGSEYLVMNKPAAPAKGGRGGGGGGFKDGGGGGFGGGGGGGGAVHSDRNLRSAVVHLVPETAACEGTTTVTLVFDEPPESSVGSGGSSSGGRGVEVSVRTKEKIDRIVATQINRRTFSFKAPDNREGDALVVVFVNGIEVASSYLRYRPSDTVHLVDGLSQIYLHFLSTVCRYMYALETKHQIPRAMHELDRLLAESFEDDKDNKHNIPLKAFEELFGILRHSSTEVIESKYEFPTLLHLTGAYGLEQLAIRLLDLPGAPRACSVFNCNKRTATELARDNGHQPVVKAFGLANKTKSDPVVTRLPSVSKQERDSKVITMMPSDHRPQRQQSPDNDYILPDKMAHEPEMEDNYMIVSQQQQQQPTTTPRKPPPAPCQKFIQSKSVTESSLPTIPPRSSLGTAAAPPVVPRRESRDSGVNVDDPPGPQPSTAIRKRPPLTKVGTEPSYTYDDEGHFLPSSQRSSQSSAAGNTVQRNLSVSGEEIARQLKKPVHAQPGSRGPSITK